MDVHVNSAERVTNMKRNIKRQSEHELSLLVFNDENLYNARHSVEFLAYIDTLFEYTPRQLVILKQDLKDDGKQE